MIAHERPSFRYAVVPNVSPRYPLWAAVETIESTWFVIKIGLANKIEFVLNLTDRRCTNRRCAEDVADALNRIYTPKEGAQ